MKASWEIKTLNQISENLDNRRVPITKSIRSHGTIPYYGASGIVDYVEDFIFNEDLLLVSEDGANLLARTYPIAFSISGRSWVNNHAHVLKFNSSTTQKFVEIYLNSIKLNDFVSGMAQPKLNQTMLNKIPIPLPPLPEQHRIVSILDEAFAAIAKAKVNAEQNLKNAKELFESYLQGVFEKTHKGWEEKRLIELCKDITVGHVGTMATKYTETGIPFLRSQNIKPHYISLKDVIFIDDNFNKELKKSQLSPGDLAIVRTGYPGTAAVIPESLKVSNCSDLVIVRVGNKIDPYFLCYFFNSSFGKKLVLGNLVGAAQKHFNVTAAKNVIIPVPPLQEQYHLIKKLDTLSAEIKKLEAIYQQKINDLEELKKSILQKAFNGSLNYDSFD